MPSPLILVIQLFSALLRLTASLELSLVPSVPTDVFLLRNSHIYLLSTHQSDTFDFIKDIFHLRKQGIYMQNYYSVFLQDIAK